MTEAVGERDRFVTTGCSNLDAILKGGIPCRGITQFYGAAGTGKTQLALQLCLTVQLPITAGGLEAGKNKNFVEQYFMISYIIQKRLKDFSDGHILLFLCIILYFIQFHS